MEYLLESTLELLGLTDKEIRFFIWNYKLGPATINDIAKKSKLERSTAYLIADDLIKKGFVQEDLRQYRKLLMTIEPKTILRMLQAKERAVGRKGLEFEEKMPELLAAYQASEFRPKVRVFEGEEGLLRVMEDILSISQEVLLWSNQETEGQFFTQEYHAQFIKTRIKQHIPIRVLTVDNKKGKELTKTDTVSLRQTKLLSPTVNFTAETYIYGNKVAIIDFTKDIIGVIIESEPMAQAQRAIFEIVWDSKEEQ